MTPSPPLEMALCPRQSTYPGLHCSSVLSAKPKANMRSNLKPEEMGKSLRIKQVTSFRSPHLGTGKAVGKNRAEKCHEPLYRGVIWLIFERCRPKRRVTDGSGFLSDKSPDEAPAVAEEFLIPSSSHGWGRGLNDDTRCAGFRHHTRGGQPALLRPLRSPTAGRAFRGKWRGTRSPGPHRPGSSTGIVCAARTELPSPSVRKSKKWARYFLLR